MWRLRVMEWLPLTLPVQAYILLRVWWAWPRTILLVLLAGVGLFNLWAWLWNHRYERAIRDTPTSRIGSAAQGYVELVGIAKPMPMQTLASPLSGRACVWYRYEVEKRAMWGGNWSSEKGARSDTPFVLEDRTGRCLVDPRQAQVFASHKKEWTSGNYRYTEELLIEGNELYVLGDLASPAGVQAQMEEKRALSDLLSKWKRDPQTLKARFDDNADGNFDTAEWERVRQAAAAEVARARQAKRDQHGENVLGPPRHGQPFVISNRSHVAIARRFTWWKHVHQAAMVAASVSMVYLLVDMGIR